MEISYTLFPTALGPAGIAWGRRGVRRIQLSAGSDEATRAALLRGLDAAREAKPPAPVREAIRLVREHLGGRSQNLGSVKLDMEGIPAFHRRVYEAARALEAGETRSYGELAELAGSPGAARAVGHAMARNPFALVVPCHRVVGASGRPGGWSGFGGLARKARLLEVEGGALFRGGEPLPYDGLEATRRLAEADPRLGELIEAKGPLRLRLQARRSPFESLLQSIVYQQLNGKAAATILGRVLALFPGKRFPEPADVLATPARRLRGAGLSRSKLAAIQDLARHAQAGVVPGSAALAQLDDEEIVERLTVVRGVGRWTVEMMLIFRLGRPDVLPVTDYGVRKGFQRAFGKRKLPEPAEIEKRGRLWRPWRSVASWYLWRANDG
ncbi:MAG TPA: methylated-DNA--[protein]-cysteine S-methyltransferase [Myxococcales bacterium]|nr:methylated-DNA--[protein]-cysteine S-methyltransferase [Myxococcales bacterium]